VLVCRRRAVGPGAQFESAARLQAGWVTPEAPFGSAAQVSVR
jgi:hypothetical protein